MEGDVQIDLEEVEDTGYRAACPRCNKRFLPDRSLVGKEREIELEFCGRCFRDATDEDAEP